MEMNSLMPGLLSSSELKTLLEKVIRIQDTIK